MPQFFYYEWYNNTVLDYLIFLGAIIASVIVIKIIGSVVIKHFKKLAQKTKTTIDDYFVKNIKKYGMPALFFTALYFDTKLLTVGDEVKKIIDLVVLAVITIMVALFASAIIVMLFNKYWEGKRTDANKELAIKTLSGLLKIVIWVIAVILFLDNINVKINTLIAGIGIGGIAIAFAAQSMLSDVFCFFTIFFDRPFEIGDFLIIGNEMGTVEYIGLKTTRLRALDGEQLVFSNSDLTSSRIQNYKTMENRRVLFSLGVTYDTKHEKLKEIPELIKNIVCEVPETTFGRAHFASYGDFSLNFEIVYFILSSDYVKYMDIHQQVNLKIKEEFDKRGIEFAFPTQTIYTASAES